jgi:hypothetical protein
MSSGKFILHLILTNHSPKSQYNQETFFSPEITKYSCFLLRIRENLELAFGRHNVMEDLVIQATVCTENLGKGKRYDFVS